MFKGTYTALVTPFKDGMIDASAFRELICKQIEASVEGIVPVGTTGESPTLSEEEHLRVIELAVREADKKIQVVAGTGANSTKEAIALTSGAESMGVDACLLVAPYYNKPSQEGLYKHFMAIAESVEIPLVLYSIPGRCGISIGEETVARLAQDADNIVAIKEAGGTVDRVSSLRQVLPEDFIILSGDDGLTLPFISVGASGVISVASNLIPDRVKKMVDLALSGNFKEAELEHRKLYGFFTTLFVETNPVPIKAALAAKGLISEDVRLPLVGLSDQSEKKLRTVLKTVL
ncbi:MAG: 4-hydroxy-tetrahydrodipicolinate synthase [Verrucomicrobiota bacterium]